jgi:uncharacterized protein (DUF2147 family)
MMPVMSRVPGFPRPVTSAARRVGGILVALTLFGSAASARAADSPVGKWNTVDDKSGQVRSEVQIFEEGGKLFGKITALADPTDADGKPRRCVKCTGADKDQPVVGLMIIRDLAPSGERYNGGTITDPEDGKVYRAEVWTEGGALRVRGYLGPFYRTQTWVKPK